MRWLCGVFLIAFGIASFASPNSNESMNSTPIPRDPSVIYGTLENGFTYFIRVNKMPKKRAFLRLAVNVGSILEEDDQQGLAHFLEHMAFNGTRHFKKQELVHYLESIGMAFGPDVNATTGFDETIFMLEVPTDHAGLLENAFLILEDWAWGITLDPTEVEKERGVVLEEWRLGRGAEARIQDKQFPVLFKGSKYAQRLPIGQKQILESFQPETLARFYSDWYRPELMAIVAVGDFDPKRIQWLIQSHFGKIPKRANPRPREYFPVPNHRETLFAIVSDPEATGNEIGIYFKSEVEPRKTVSDYRRILLENLFDAMMNQRFSEVAKKPDPPFLYALSGKGRLVRTKGVYYVGAGVKDNEIERGFEALLTELERVRRYGFLEAELERAKRDWMRSLEKAYAEKEKTESSRYASQYVRHFLSGDPIPGIEWELQTARKLLPEIQVQDLNRLAKEWMPDTNRVVLIGLPEKPGIKKPKESDLFAIWEKVSQSAVQPYRDEALELPLISEPPRPGFLVEEKENKKLGIVEWKLSNGITVILKPTEFKNDEVRFYAFSPGGNSLVRDYNAVSSMVAPSIVRESGVGMFNAIQLEKKLAGRVVRVSPYIGRLTEGVSGSASPQDLETLFQLIYLTLTSPRKDTSAFSSYLARLKGMLENRSQQPESVFQDTLQATLAQYHYWARPWSMALLNEIHLDSCYAIYQDRFRDCGDFTFFFVGKFNPDSLKPWVLTYLGGLPSQGRKEMWRDLGIRPPRGVVKKVVRKGIEEKSLVSLVFTGPYEWSLENNYLFESMAGFLRLRLRERLREELGGTYGVSVIPSYSRYPREEYTLSISFGCAPNRVDELIRMVFLQIDSLKTLGPSEADVKKIKEIQRRDYEENLQRNGFWLDALSDAYFYKVPLSSILEYPERVQRLSVRAIRDTARRWISTENYVQVSLLPEKQ